MRNRVLLVALLLALLATTAGGASEAAPASSESPAVRIAAVGDIACKDPPRNNRRVCRYDDVSNLVAEVDPDAFLVLGDVQYEYGRYRDFIENYDRYFGRFLPITYPVAGNHDWGVEGAAGYFRYFGRRARPPEGYYSFDLGTWHVIALDTDLCSPYYGDPCGPKDPQYEWLKADLAAHPNDEYACTLAYFHHPRWDWLKYQNASWTESFDLERAAGFWKLLYEARADVVLAGHNHNYQHYLPTDPRGDFDPDRGVTEFVVGTGGRNLNDLGSQSTRPVNFLTGQDSEFGVLVMRLEPGRYDYRFASTAAHPGFVDAASDVACR